MLDTDRQILTVFDGEIPKDVLKTRLQSKRD